LKSVRVAIVLAAGVATTVAAVPSSAGPECFGRAATIVRGDANNVINGTSDDDVIFAGGGNDTVYGKGGHDRICTGAGRDSAFGLNGNDRMNGGPGSDMGQVNNTYNVGGLFGGDGSDTILGADGTDHVWADFNAGNNVHGADENSDENVLKGGAGPDWLLSNRGTDDMFGQGGNDRLEDAARDWPTRTAPICSMEVPEPIRATRGTTTRTRSIARQTSSTESTCKGETFGERQTGLR
jgi:hypothetical protein